MITNVIKVLKACTKNKSENEKDTIAMKLTMQLSEKFNSKTNNFFISTLSKADSTQSLI